MFYDYRTPADKLIENLAKFVTHEVALATLCALTTMARFF